MALIDYLTFKEIQDEVANLVQDTGTDRKTVIKPAINMALRQISKRYLWPEMNKTESMTRAMRTKTSLTTLQQSNILLAGNSTTLPTSVVSGHQALGLMMSKVFRIRYTEPDKSVTYGMEQVDQDDFDAYIGNNPELEGPPCIWCSAGRTPMPFPLLADSTSYWASTNVNDAGTIRVLGDQFISAGAQVEASDITGESQWTHETITISGATSIAGTKLKKGWSVKTVLVGAANTGVIVGGFKNAASGSAVVTFFGIRAEDITANFAGVTRVPDRPMIRVYPNPDKNYLFIINYKEQILELVHDDDVPRLPVATYLVERATATIFENMRRHDMANVHKSNAEQAVIELVSDMNLGQIKIAVPRQTRDYNLRGYR